MDCKFENISVQKKENLLEMYKRTLRKSFLVYGIAVAVLFLLFVITSLLTGTISLIYTALYVIVVLIAGNWVLRMPKKLRNPPMRPMRSSSTVNRRPIPFSMRMRCGEEIFSPEWKFRYRTVRSSWLWRRSICF